MQLVLRLLLVLNACSGPLWSVLPVWDSYLVPASVGLPTWVSSIR